MRQVQARFEHEAEAKAARESLLADGIEPQRISILNRSRARPARPSEQAEKGRGIWANLKEMVAPHDEVPADQGARLRQDGYLLTVSVADEKLEGVIALLAKTGSVEFDGADADAPDADDEVRLPVTEERLAVDVHSTDRGGVRLSSRTDERPVHDRVHLYDYRVSIRRRAVDDPVGPAGLGRLDDLFRERVVEMTETTDEVRFLKEARVREEVIVSKEVQERVEHVDTTLRRTRVEVDDMPAGATPVLRTDGR